MIVLLQDSHVQEWIRDYGEVTSYSFIVYGPLEDTDLVMIQQGLSLRLLHRGEDANMLFIEEKVTEELANALGIFRGVQVNLVFRGDNTNLHDLIVDTVSEGLDYLKLKHKFVGGVVRDEYV